MSGVGTAGRLRIADNNLYEVVTTMSLGKGISGLGLH